jgi:hypothetical protein
MRIILMLRSVLSLLLVAALAFQAVGAAAATSFASPAQHVCHDSYSDSSSHGCCSETGAAAGECTAHCLNAPALPLSVFQLPPVSTDSYERPCAVAASTRFDVPPLPPPIR